VTTVSAPRPSAPTRAAHTRWRPGSVEVLAVLLVALVLFRERISGLLAGPEISTWTTVFVSVMVQATPFLVFGVALSAVIAVFVPRSFWSKALPSHPALAVPVASCAGVILPGCECGSVGAVAAATINVFVPERWLTAVVALLSTVRHAGAE
jgi:uncharacterized protein